MRHYSVISLLRTVFVNYLTPFYRSTNYLSISENNSFVDSESNVRNVYAGNVAMKE